MMNSSTDQPKKRLAIIGGGSSGLIALKSAIDALPDWDIVCFEKSDRIIGVWGNPFPGFISTSTKYTTQFACFAVYDASTDSNGKMSRDEFFRDDEYGNYLERFADAFQLRPHIRLRHSVREIRRSEAGTTWQLNVCREADGGRETSETFDQIIICTGLTAEPKRIDCGIPCLSVADLHGHEGLEKFHSRRIVVMGGGESAVDYACRLARSELVNQVFLSLRSGIRVSPRYHPIRGVPSDFLRNRLMLSIHEDLRNRIGQRFVEWRIKYQERFERLFPPKRDQADRKATIQVGGEFAINSRERAAIRKEWAYRLTKGAKDALFNMFHNKSDDFLDLVAEGRITIVGAPVDEHFQQYREFDTEETVDVSPDNLVPAIGYGSTLERLFGGAVRLTDFHLGCVHVVHPDLFAVGFARPIIGNIPTISEVQARYICGIIAGKYPRPENIEAAHAADRAMRDRRFQHLDLQRIYPVEMFAYCDDLARRMDLYPSLAAAGSLGTWWRMQLSPATTLHYLPPDVSARKQWKASPIYIPWPFVLILLMLKPVDAIYRMGLRFWPKRAERKKVMRPVPTADNVPQRGTSRA